MAKCFQLLVGCLSVLAIMSDCSAQQLTVQQPVVGRFGIQTTVSVPDRGTALLGRVGRQGFSRYSTGPFRSGSSVGRFTEHRGASVSVYIHDFEELERQLLASSPRTQLPPDRLSGRSFRLRDPRLRQLPSKSATALTGISIRESAGAGIPSNSHRSTNSTGPAKTSIADTAYGRERMARRRNLDRMLQRVRNYR